MNIGHFQLCFLNYCTLTHWHSKGEWPKVQLESIQKIMKSVARPSNQGANKKLWHLTLLFFTKVCCAFSITIWRLYSNCECPFWSRLLYHCATATDHWTVVGGVPSCTLQNYCLIILISFCLDTDQRPLMLELTSLLHKLIQSVKSVH